MQSAQKSFSIFDRTFKSMLIFLEKILRIRHRGLKVLVHIISYLSICSYFFLWKATLHKSKEVKMHNGPSLRLMDWTIVHLIPAHEWGSVCAWVLAIARPEQQRLCR